MQESRNWKYLALQYLSHLLILLSLLAVLILACIESYKK